MSFNIIKSSKNISKKYYRYLSTIFDIKDDYYKEIFLIKLKENELFEKGPFLDVTNSFKKGRSLKQLIEDGIVSSEFSKIEKLYKIPNLYCHQEQALLSAIKGENLIVSTGTGSGKTESFLLPLINHLLIEKENNTLNDKVRALIIYPMNALANDQIDRLRKLFIDYPDITFGCYTGQTKGDENDARKQYYELNEDRTDYPRLRKPLPNERISRESMKKNPPHILITNYAMLEFLLLRPDDNVFFDGENGNNWKYIILDEAHTYTGSTGIEVSMLLRRLRARINKDDIQFILTSATLGDEEANEEVIEFAENLCSVEFKEENIIRAQRVNLNKISTCYTLNSDFYQYVNDLLDNGYSHEYIINELEDKYNFNIQADNLSEYLYELLNLDDTFWKIKEFVTTPKEITEICEYVNYNEDEISSFVEVASIAAKNDSKLFDARYHMFLRATDGVYITLSPHKDLFLTRKNMVYDNGEKYKVFEVVSCKQCHSLYILGYIDGDYLVQRNTADTIDIKEAFYLGDQINDSDEDDSLENSNLAVENYQLCPHCGFIRSEKEVVKRSCGHDESHFVNIIKVKTTNKEDGRVTKCICCENSNRLGILRGLFSGQEASTAVIGTALFEELPSHEIVVSKHNDVNDEDDGFDIEVEDNVDEVIKAKQFIAFSDSRQAAAYFASYFSITYESLLYGRIIKDALDSISKERINIDDLVDNISVIMNDNSINHIDEYLEKIETHSNNINYDKIAWQAILQQFVDCNQQNSLIGLGLLALSLNDNVKFAAHKQYGLNSDEVRDICMVFIMGMLADAAMYYKQPLNDYDKEFFTHNGVEYSYLRDSSEKYVRAFIPKKDSFSNKRLNYLSRVLKTIDNNISKEDVKKVLGKIWDAFFVSSNPNKASIMYKDRKAHYKVNIHNLEIVKNKKWYRCNKCNKLTCYNVRNVCPSYSCDGKLLETNIDDEINNNHYYRMYNDTIIQPMRVVEHTAQLNREEAYKYQNLFRELKIDVLSCSTTFEMGVDVGDLETVFMRNMPPTASNYAQRAGRAGRSSTSAAFALTFCNKSNHDFNFFDRPKEMICGKITPPQFKTDNEKICIRHLYSSVFSYFFKLYPGYFSTAKEMMTINPETDLSGYDVLYKFLKEDSEKRDELKEYLKKSIPESLHDKFMIDSFGWIDLLFSSDNSEYPSLKIVQDIYLNEINILEKEKNKAKDADNYSFIGISNRIKTYENERIINFLSKSNILPKYGFPVDTVELIMNNKSKENDFIGLDLTRDLSMAISEYAPGCQVVANNKLVTSRYIKMMPNKDFRKYDYIKCKHCETLNIEPSTLVNQQESLICSCKQCNSVFDKRSIKTFLIPEFGFIAEENVGKPSLIKPEKTYRTEATYYNYNDCSPEYAYKVGSTIVNVSHIGNDGEMAMLNTSDFFMCHYCGYTIEAPKDIVPFQKTINEKNKHKDPNGYYCNNKILHKYSLGYKFKTDVLKIQINHPLLSDSKHNEAYSILQALVLSICKELDIENGEIAGCLQYYYNEDVNYNYLLYDTTPGGAGHVKRVNNQNIITNVLTRTLSIAKECTNCDIDTSCYSCLRTYQNKKYHDNIKRVCL